MQKSKTYYDTEGGDESVSRGVNSDEENIDRVLDSEEKGATFLNDSGEESTAHGEEGTDCEGDKGEEGTDHEGDRGEEGTAHEGDGGEEGTVLGEEGTNHEGDGGEEGTGCEGDGGEECTGHGSDGGEKDIARGYVEGVDHGCDSDEEDNNRGGVGKDDDPIIIDEHVQTAETMWVKDLGLYFRDRDVLGSNVAWINDNIKYGAQLLLKEQSKGRIEGWQNTQCSNFKDLFPPIAPFSRFVQILHVRENHWVTVSNMKVPGDYIFYDSVCIYDSLFSSSISTDTKKQICSFVKPKGKHLRLDVMNMQMQDNLHDCGLFAVACAAELANNRDPCVAHFQPEQMRAHLMDCLENKKMTPFPLKKTRRVGFGKKIKYTKVENIYCYCRMPNYNKKLAMVLCSTCLQWFHLKCIDDIISTNPKEKWHCTACAPLLKV